MIEDVKIGKQILENLTLGMYTNPEFIYREYIQNSADAIDNAIRLNIINKDEAIIDIDINPKQRRITIYDNATGISLKDVKSGLINIADSIKDREKNKGFRGIGRLGGLAYCKKLVFETSYKGEDKKTIMTWDAELLEKIINNSEDNCNANTAVARVIKFEEKEEEKDSHYFKVILYDIKTSNEILLDEDKIREYLSFVAPVLFSRSTFPLSEKIDNYTNNLELKLDSYNIRLNTDSLYKGYHTALYEANDNKTNKKRYDEITDIQFKEFYDSNNELLAWCWVGLSKFEKCIPERNAQRCIRLKKHNIQIGEQTTLNEFHKEPRGNGYFVGEVHAVHRNLIPNARRDYFNENTTRNEFEIQIKQYFFELYQLYHYANDLKNEIKKTAEFIKLNEEFKEKDKNNNFLDSEERNSFVEKIEAKKIDYEKAMKNIVRLEDKSNDNEIFKKVYNNINKEYKAGKIININHINNQNTYKKNNFRTSKLNQLSRAEKKLLGNVFKIIKDVLEPQLAENLINKIEENYR